MTTIKARRTDLTFVDLMKRWGWDENDMRDAVINQGLMPSYFIYGAVWQRPLDATGGRARAGAASVYELMYLTRFHKTGALDGYFDRCAREPDALDNGGDVFEVGGVGVEGNRVSLADVLEKGVVAMSEIARFEESCMEVSEKEPSADNSAKTQWWNEDYNVWAMAKEIESKGADQGWGVNQSGARAGRYPLNRIGDAVAAKIATAELAAGSTRKILGKTIINYLKKRNWK